MDTARNEPPGPGEAPVALIALTLLVYAAGFTMVAAWFALLLFEPPATKSPGVPTCTVCGVVERVGEFERANFSLNGDQDESIIRVLAQLSGLKDDAPPRLYETAVLHDDGTVRVVRDASAPHWKQGDRVRVVRGRIEPVALQASRD